MPASILRERDEIYDKTGRTDDSYLMDSPPRTVLITPPVYDFAFYDLFCKPYGLLRVARWLADAGYEIEYINALDPYDEVSIRELGAPRRRPNGTGKLFRSDASWSAETRNPTARSPVQRQFSRYGITESSFASRLEGALSRRTDVVLIGTGMTYWYPGVRETVDAVRRITRGQAPTIVAGGVYASLMPDHCASTCGVDLVTKGRAEVSLPPILEQLDLPIPAGSPTARVLATDPVWRDSCVICLNSGCPFRCDYCASAALTGGFAPENSADDAYSALSEIADRWGTNNVAFYDDALLHHAPDRFDRFLDLATDSGREYNFFLPNAVHITQIDETRAKRMKDAGFAEVRFGYESASSGFHNSHGVKFAPSQVAEAVSALRSAGFADSSITLYLLAGLPDQDPGEVRESIGVAAELSTRIEIAEFSPVPGSDLWERCVMSSPFPLEMEPLYHNNTLFPLRSERFSHKTMGELKALAHQVGVRTSTSSQ